MQIYGRPDVPLTAVISGGVFDGGVALHLIGATVSVIGGDFLRHTVIEQGSSATLAGGQDRTNYIEVRDSSVVTMTGGSFDEFDLYGRRTVLNMDGGGLGYGVLSTGNSIVNLRGGHFPTIQGAELRQNSIWNVYGQNLTFQNGILQGTLQDGTPIDTNVRVRDSGVVNLFTIPEPSSFALVVAGSTAMIAFGCKSKAIWSRWSGFCHARVRGCLSQVVCRNILRHGLKPNE